MGKCCIICGRGGMCLSDLEVGWENVNGFAFITVFVSGLGSRGERKGH